MGLKEKVIRDLDELDAGDLVVLSEQIRRLKRTKRPGPQALSVDEILHLTASSASTWSDDVLMERSERG